MDLIVTCHGLTGFGGSESYAVTVADHLQRLGHEVWLTAPELGASAEVARDLGVRVVAPSRLPAHADAILSQDAAGAYELADSHPGVPQVFVAHSDLFDHQLPPALPGVVAKVVTLYDRVDRRVRALATEHDVVRLRQPVDVERFKPLRPLPERPRVALALSNYVAGPRAELLRAACAQAGLELRHVGAHGDGPAPRPEAVLNAADVVFGKARVVLEAMACGRAAYVLDHNGAEGWVTAANREALAADNFGGQSAPVELDAAALAADLARYDPESGLANRDYVVARHGAGKHAAALVDVLRDAAGAALPGPPADAPLRELARLTRLYGRADAQAFFLQTEVQRSAAGAAEGWAAAEEAATYARTLEARVEVETARADAQAARADAEAARAAAAEREAQRARAEAEAHAAAAAHARADRDAVVATTRWRALNAALRPVDRLRLGRRSARS